MATGRPRLVFDLDQVREVAGLDGTYAEIAAVLGCSPDTVARRMDDDPAFAEAYREGREQGKTSIRRKLYKLADHNAAAAIFLAKNRLGMRDQVSIEHSGEVKPAPVETEAERSERTAAILGVLQEAGVVERPASD